MRSHVSIITSSTMCISWPPMCLYFWKCQFLHRRLWKWSIPVSNCDLYQLFRQSFCHIWTLFLNVSVKLACSLLTIALMTVCTTHSHAAWFRYFPPPAHVIQIISSSPILIIWIKCGNVRCKKERFVKFCMEFNVRKWGTSFYQYFVKSVTSNTFQRKWI